MLNPTYMMKTERRKHKRERPPLSPDISFFTPNLRRPKGRAPGMALPYHPFIFFLALYPSLNLTSTHPSPLDASIPYFSFLFLSHPAPSVHRSFLFLSHPHPQCAPLLSLPLSPRPQCAPLLSLPLSPRPQMCTAPLSSSLTPPPVCTAPFSSSLTPPRAPPVCTAPLTLHRVTVVTLGCPRPRRVGV